jgi:glycosyltransferase involved in cell wall biosynthesis
MKTILFVEQNQDGTIGGSHFCLLYLIRCLDRAKYKPIVMFYEDVEIKSKFLELQCEVIIYRKPLGKRFFHGFSFFQKIYNFTNRNILPTCKFFLFILKKKIDLVHLNNSSTAGLEWLLAAKLLRKKCITHERGWPTKRNVLNSRFVKYFDKVICVSSSVKNQLVKVDLKSDSIVIYDGMDPVEYEGKIRRSATETRNDFVGDINIPFFGMVGNFQEWKGQTVVVEAVRKLVIKYPRLVCLLVGGVSKSNPNDIYYYKKLVNKINESNINEHIVITGYRSDVPDIINAFDLFIHASTAPEPFGMVLLEAMCLSKAVIATNLGGPTEIIEDEKSGLLVKPADPDALAKKVDFLLENPNKRAEIGNNARRQIKEKFSLDKFSSNLSQLYENIFKN